jgi:hydrogenase maturation protease
MMPPRVLIAGVGNVFLGDDAFGVEVVRRLATRALPDGVRVRDFGIRGLDLAYALLDRCDAAILVDAAPRGAGPPGTLYVIEADPGPPVRAAEGPGIMLDTHAMDPEKVLRLVAAMNGRIGRVLIVGCEPATLGAEDDVEMGLSPPVAAAVEEAVKLVESLVATLVKGEPEAVG